jgi:hypothetical protein
MPNLTISDESLTIDELIMEAFLSSKHTESARWLKEARKDVLSGKGYPSEQEMDYHSVTPAGFLVLTGLVNAYPGGGANPLTPEVLNYQIKEIRDSGGSHENMHIILGTHGSISPLYSSINGPVDDPRFAKFFQDRIRLVNGYHLNLLHNLGSCGLSEGSTPFIRKMLQDVIHQLADSENFKNISVMPLEALIGREIKNRDLVVPSFIFDFYNNDNLGFHVHKTGVPSSIKLQTPIDEKLIDYRQLNNILRKVKKGI